MKVGWPCDEFSINKRTSRHLTPKLQAGCSTKSLELLMQGRKTKKPHEQSVKAPVHHNRIVHNFRVHRGDSVHTGQCEFEQKNDSPNLSSDFVLSGSKTGGASRPRTVPSGEATDLLPEEQTVQRGESVVVAFFQDHGPTLEFETSDGNVAFI